MTKKDAEKLTNTLENVIPPPFDYDQGDASNTDEIIKLTREEAEALIERRKEEVESQPYLPPKIMQILQDKTRREQNRKKRGGKFLKKKRR
jgi:hypothetical protein